MHGGESLSFGIVESWPSAPPGCFTVGGGLAHFNTDDVGGVAESDSPVCQARYFVGATNTKTCPTGSHQILNEADCRAAATDVGLSFADVTAETQNPPGCFVARDYSRNSIYYNKNKVGGVTEVNSPVCQTPTTNGIFKIISTAQSGGHWCVRKYQRRGWLKYGKCNGKELHFQTLDLGAGKFALQDVTSGSSGGCVRVQRKKLRLVSKCRTSSGSKNFQWSYITPQSQGPERLLLSSKDECVHIGSECGDKGCKPFTMEWCGDKDGAWMVPIMIQAPRTAPAGAGETR